MSSTHLNEGRDISYHVHYMYVLYYIYFVEQITSSHMKVQLPYPVSNHLN